MTTLRDAAQQALGALETVLSDAYHRRFPECCGRPGSECCGNPNEAWAPEDNKIMDALSPVQRQLSDALRAALAEQPAEQEPVAWWHRKSNTFTSGNLVSNFAEWAPLYTAPQPAKPAEQEPVAWEWRWFDTSPYTVTSGQWSEWTRVEPRNSLCTLDDALNEFRAYIANGLRYELRAIYTAPQPAIPPGYKLVPIQKLVELKASIHGDCFRGTDWELETISTMLAAAPEAPQPAKLPRRTT